MAGPLHVVTGAMGYSGSHIARRLLDAGLSVRTLTNTTPRTDPFGGRVEMRPLSFDKPTKLTEALRGAEVLYNTYWVRFNYAGRGGGKSGFSFAQAVENSRTLFRCAREAGVRRIVHVSITNPDENSDLEYFRGKAQVEKSLVESGLSYAILRPAVLFGGEDILINNIAWVLRRMPVFGVFGDGLYKLQPIHVEDFAAIAVDAGGRQTNEVIEAIGPETFTYRGLAEAIGKIIGIRRRIVSVSPATGYAIGKVMGWWKRDVTITREEIRGLMEGRLFVDTPPQPLATTKLTAWAAANRQTLGRRYASELLRRR